MVKSREKLATDFGRIKAVIGSEQINAVIKQAKQQEQIEAEQKRAAKRKHNPGWRGFTIRVKNCGIEKWTR